MKEGTNPNSKKGKYSRLLYIWRLSSIKNPKIIIALLEAGADPKAKDKDGKIPWDYAKGNEALKVTNAFWRLKDLRF